MKDYFIHLFNYDRHSNLQIAEMIGKPGDPEKPVQLMAHLLASQQVWLARVKHEPTVGGALWPDWKVDTFLQTIHYNHRGWMNFLDHLQPHDLDNMVSYKNSRGESFENKLSDVLAHVINHGTHHRAQIGQYLKIAGIDLPPTDYIFYIRELEQNK
jgi:uncharacterized damage-inducible protein DinB